MADEEELIAFFLNSKSKIVQYETIELSHPDFSQSFYVVRNNTSGLTATLETAVEVDFNYYPMRIEPNAASDDLDYSIKIEFGDLGEIVPNELDLLMAGDGFQTKPTLVYRTFRSDDLSAPMVGPVSLEVAEFSFNRTGVGFEARAPRLNIYGTGELYRIDRFQMLRGFL